MLAKINDITMNFDVTGSDSAPAVVLHHPLATDLTIWDELTAALRPRYRVVRMDARGHGRTDAPRGVYTFETLALDVVQLLDHLGIAKAQFVGLSMGGMIGQFLGVLHPDRFSSLCLVSTSSATAPEGRPLIEERIKMAQASGMAALADGTIARWLSTKAQADNPALVERLRRLITATPVDGYVGWMRAISGLRMTERLGAISLPTRVIVGAADPSTPPAAARTIHEHIPGSDLVVLPGVSHMLQVEAPDAFHAHVLPFLAAHEAP